jgi:hypothetical protein
MSNLFAEAKKVPAKKAAAKKAEEPRVETAGLEVYAAIDALEKQLKALKATVRPELDALMIGHFVNNGPENYKGEEGQATASLELRKRSSASALNDSEQELLADSNISTEVVEDRPETYIINPAYAGDAKLLKKVSDAISKVAGLPTDFLQFQESTKKTVVTETSMTEVFRLNDKTTIASLIPVVGTLAIKPKTTASVKELMTTIAALIEE